MNTVVTAAIMALLAWPAAISAQNLDRYGKQQLTLKQNRYSHPTWSNGVSRSGWASSYGVDSGHMMRHYPVSMNRYRTMAGASDYYDTDLSGAHDPRSYDQLDYAVVRYPSYGGGGGGYYPATANLAAAYDGGASNGLMYNDIYGGGRDPVAAALTSSSSPYYPSMAANTINRFEPPPAPQQQQSSLNRYESVRYPPTDKIHKFRKVFMSNLVSPSNVFKSTKEQQLYDFWESLITDGMDNSFNGDGDDDDDAGEDNDVSRAGGDSDGQQHIGRQQSTTSLLYQHLPSIFQQLQQQQKLKYQQRQQSADERTQSSASSSASDALPHGNLYKQWTNGSPLIKRSPPSQQSDVNDDVRQLERLKTDNSPRTNTTADTTTAATTTAVTSTTTVPPPSMADGGQREYVLPRPAGEKSSFESLLEVFAEGGLHGHGDKNGEANAHSKVSTFTMILLHYFHVC